jgi:hypothetical protein
MSTKDFSTKQEQMIADYLGWSRVVGSGARPTFTGDVIAAEWLGECKTHVKPGHKILFDTKVWNKIVSEASAKFKQPAYFVDDGSQKDIRTWVMFMDRSLSSKYHVADYPYKINNTTTFVHSEMKAITPEMTVYRLHFDSYDVMIATLETFETLI